MKYRDRVVNSMVNDLYTSGMFVVGLEAGPSGDVQVGYFPLI